MIESTHLRQRGSLDFESHYEHLCALHDLVPLKSVKANLYSGVLDINGDRIKLPEWTPIFNSIRINRHLAFLAVRSYYQPGLGETGSERHKQYIRKRMPAIRSKGCTLQLCASIRDCLIASSALKSLELQGLPLRHGDLTTLTKGLSRTKSLQNISLAYCPIGDEGLEIICKSLKNSATIKTINFTGCNLTWCGAEHITKVIKYQATKRHSEVWAESLRYRHPDLDCMTGLRRITMNCNSLIGDTGAVAFAEALKDDLWLKALDLQQCGMSNEGAKALLNSLQSSTTLIVLDVRKNPLIDRSLTKSIIERILLNGNAMNSEYKWLTLTSSREPSKQKQRRKTLMLGHGLKGKATIRIGTRKFAENVKKSAAVSSDFIPEPMRPGAEGYVPWRTAARANRFRGIHQGSPHQNKVIQARTPVKVTLESASSSDTEEATYTPNQLLRMTVVGDSSEAISVKQYKRIKVELEECNLRLKEEMRARAKADAQLIKLEIENTRLRNINVSISDALHSQSITDTILEDEGVLESIEASFQKFHAFLDLLKDAGLGQLATIAGIDQSDFGSMGRPRLSSTVGNDKSKDIIHPEAPPATQFHAADQATVTHSEPEVIPNGSTSPSIQLANQSADLSHKNLQSAYSNFERESGDKFQNLDERYNDKTSKQLSLRMNDQQQEQATTLFSAKLLDHSGDDGSITSGTCDTHSERNPNSRKSKVVMKKSKKQRLAIFSTGGTSLTMGRNKNEQVTNNEELLQSELKTNITENFHSIEELRNKADVDF
ncbi:centrosomal protein of 78 kDa isoform X2 [Amblyraja radiata]|uniref:centrosomal protein of 78 kDa isoform X2 n=1 Tax=Amblyraja radiata TaxID=386614 RepID=UPI0014020996|nr:centrosomal protein of 78 kDa isoform X2 [Amblyraja radiata]XP_032873482.1 centrosomal protein of 78 kDa isoform X2 [Amblyraja radiata]